MTAPADRALLRLRRGGTLAWSVLGIVGLVVVVGYAAWTVRVIWPPLILAAAIVFLLNPIVTRLQRAHVPRALGAGLAYLGVVLVLVLAGVLVAPVVADQADELSQEWPEIRSDIETWVDARAEESEGTFYEFTREELEDSVAGGNTPVADQLDRAFDIGVQVFHVLVVLVLAPIIAFYLLVDLPRLMRIAEELVPEGARDDMTVLATRLNRAIGGFFRGQLLVALIVGVMVSIGLGIVGLKFWFLVGMIAGLFNIVPLIGPYIGGIPGVVIALTTGSPLQAVAVVAVMVAAQQIDNHFITPTVMQRAVQLHPAYVMLALLAGGTLAGFLGLLLAVPGAAVLKIVCGHVWRVHVLGQPLDDVEALHDAEDDQADSEGVVEDVADEPENDDTREGDRADDVSDGRLRSGLR